MRKGYFKDRNYDIYENMLEVSYYMGEHILIDSLAVPPGPSSIENDAQGIKKLLLKKQVS